LWQSYLKDLPNDLSISDEESGTKFQECKAKLQAFLADPLTDESYNAEYLSRQTAMRGAQDEYNVFVDKLNSIDSLWNSFTLNQNKIKFATNNLDQAIGAIKVLENQKPDLEATKARCITAKNQAITNLNNAILDLQNKQQLYQDKVSEYDAFVNLVTRTDTFKTEIENYLINLKDNEARLNTILTDVNTFETNVANLSASKIQAEAAEVAQKLVYDNAVAAFRTVRDYLDGLKEKLLNLKDVKAILDLAAQDKLQYQKDIVEAQQTLAQQTLLEGDTTQIVSLNKQNFVTKLDTKFNAAGFVESYTEINFSGTNILIDGQNINWSTLDLDTKRKIANGEIAFEFDQNQSLTITEAVSYTHLTLPTIYSV